jgi:hypothetical protein
MIKVFATGFSFAIAIPFIILGFAWHFISYCFAKGREVCANYFEYLE